MLAVVKSDTGLSSEFGGMVDGAVAKINNKKLCLIGTVAIMKKKQIMNFFHELITCSHNLIYYTLNGLTKNALTVLLLSVSVECVNAISLTAKRPSTKFAFFFIVSSALDVGDIAIVLVLVLVLVLGA